MNNPNPFLPQGAFLEQKNKARTRLKIAVFFSISLSVMVLMALLIQGCRKPNDQVDGSNGSATDTLANANTNTPSLTTPPAEMATTSNTATTLPPETNPAPPVAVTPPPPPVAETQDYTIVKGDTFATIASTKGTTATAIAKANPGVDPRKLKIGQKIHLPAPASSTSTSVSPMSAPGSTETAAPGGAVTYKVKSGDTLTTIAKKYHGVTAKAIQSANNLTSTRINVGQVLKIPTEAAPAPAPAPVDSMPPPVATPVPAITSAPPAGH